MAVTFLRKMFGDRTDDNIFLCSYANVRGEFPAYNSVISISQPDLAERIKACLKKYDVRGRAVYIGVNPVRGRKKGKDQIASINSLHVEIDFKGILQSKRAILAVLRSLKIKPSVVVFSGHGFHLYWLYDRPLGREHIRTHEALLKQATRALAGDMSAAEVARVLRLPGSHNSKYEGEWLGVKVIKELTNWKTHRVADLKKWFVGLEPLLTYKPKPGGIKTAAEVEPARNVYQQYYRDTRPGSGGFDASERLAEMQYGGVHGNGINDTYAAIVGGMVRAGESLEDVLKTLLVPTQKVYERDRMAGEGPWSEKRATKEIAELYRRLRRKDELETIEMPVGEMRRTISYDEHLARQRAFLTQVLRRT